MVTRTVIQHESTITSEEIVMITKELQLGFRKRVPLVLQTEGSECGLACLSMIAAFHGHEADLASLRKRFMISLKGVTLERIVAVADQIGLISRPLRIEMQHLPKLQTPALLHWNLNHYVVLKSVRGKHVYINDPGLGELKLTLHQVSEQFTGIALELTPGFNFQRKKPRPPVELHKLIGNITGLKRGLLQTLILALALEILTLAFPLVTQWITDDAIVTNDRELLATLGIGMVALGVSTTAITAARTWIGMYISTNFNLQWMSNVMGHLLRLPVEYFERRHLGDIVSRFEAVRAIEHRLTSAIVDAFLDGLLAIGTLIMMFLYSVKLSSISLLASLLYGLLRWVRYGSLQTASSGSIAKQAKEQTYFLETIRGVRSIKLYGKESQRRSAWLNLWVNSTNATLIIQKLNLLFSTGWSLLSTFERSIVLWAGALAVMDHELTLGMLFAFLTYKEQFSTKTNQLVDRFVDFKMLNVYGERLADIVLTKPEETHAFRRQEFPLELTLKFENISYRYAADENFILEDCDFTVNMGEFVAITGPSGCGKTTCLKLMLGILSPTSGAFKIGGLTLAQLGLEDYRKIIATVLQDDQLFAGSIYDNICFLDDKPDDSWLLECAEAANIHSEICAMPMGYHTLIGDMGTVLSGGQKQRILLARALYRRPKILFLDEATSHLDIENEEKINRSILALKITRVIIAHRPQTIKSADRVVVLRDGKLVDASQRCGDVLEAVRDA